MTSHELDSLEYCTNENSSSRRLLWPTWQKTIRHVYPWPVTGKFFVTLSKIIGGRKKTVADDFGILSSKASFHTSFTSLYTFRLPRPISKQGPYFVTITASLSSPDEIRSTWPGTNTLYGLLWVFLPWEWNSFILTDFNIILSSRKLLFVTLLNGTLVSSDHPSSERYLE